MFLGGNNAADVPANAHTRAMEQMPPDARPQYVAYPPPDSPEVSRYMAKCCTQRAWARGDQNVAFIGQVPRLLPLQYIPWALDLLLEEYGTRWVLQTQPNGCAKAWVDDEAHCTTLTERSKTMLFDVCGVWVARTRPQIDASMAYQATLQSQGPLDGRVPRHGMIAEKLRPPQGVLRKELHEREQMMRAQGMNPGTGGPLAPSMQPPPPAQRGSYNAYEGGSAHAHGGRPQPHHQQYGFNTGSRQPAHQQQHQQHYDATPEPANPYARASEPVGRGSVPLFTPDGGASRGTNAQAPAFNPRARDFQPTGPSFGPAAAAEDNRRSIFEHAAANAVGVRPADAGVINPPRPADDDGDDHGFIFAGINPPQGH